MCVICLNNGPIIVDGEYFVPSYWYKINAESENLFLMMLHLILNHKPNSTFSYMYRLNIQFGDGFVGNETENRVAKQVDQG